MNTLPGLQTVDMSAPSASSTAPLQSPAGAATPIGDEASGSIADDGEYPSERAMILADVVLNAATRTRWYAVLVGRQPGVFCGS
jgi:hypothetical protein